MTTSRENHRVKYGSDHQRLRKAWVPVVGMGLTLCAHQGCNELIKAGAPWDLGHRYNDRGLPIESLPMHRACNRNTAHSDRERDTGRLDDKPGGTKNSREWK